jgi:translocation and assembly module TamB
VRTLAGKGGEGVNGKVRQGLALDDLDVTTSDTGATEARAGKYISENIYSEVTADTEGNSQINLNLNINRAVTARGRLASDGETGIGVFIEKDY